MDYVRISAHYTSLLEGGKEEVRSDLKARGFTEEQIAEARKHSQAKFSPVTIQNLKFTRHLSNFKYGLMGFILHLFSNYERGVLPFPGSLTEQPAQIIEIFNLLLSLRDAYTSGRDKNVGHNNQRQSYARNRRQSRTKSNR